MAAPVVGCGGGRRAGGVGRQVRHLRAAPAQLMRRMTVVVLLVVEAVCEAVLEAGLAVVAGVALVDCRRTLSEKNPDIFRCWLLIGELKVSYNVAHFPITTGDNVRRCHGVDTRVE